MQHAGVFDFTNRVLEQLNKGKRLFKKCDFHTTYYFQLALLLPHHCFFLFPSPVVIWFCYILLIKMASDQLGWNVLYTVTVWSSVIMHHGILKSEKFCGYKTKNPSWFICAYSNISYLIVTLISCTEYLTPSSGSIVLHKAWVLEVLIYFLLSLRFERIKNRFLDMESSHYKGKFWQLWQHAN